MTFKTWWKFEIQNYFYHPATSQHHKNSMYHKDQVSCGLNLICLYQLKYTKCKQNQSQFHMWQLCTRDITIKKKYHWTPHIKHFCPLPVQWLRSGVGDLGMGVGFPAKAEMFLFSIASGLSLGPIQPNTKPHSPDCKAFTANKWSLTSI
jgi:hypothetical protein